MREKAPTHSCSTMLSRCWVVPIFDYLGGTRPKERKRDHVLEIVRKLLGRMLYRRNKVRTEAQYMGAFCTKAADSRMKMRRKQQRKREKRESSLIAKGKQNLIYDVSSTNVLSVTVEI